MAIVLQEDWSSYAENTEVQSIPGWTTAGYFAVNRAGAKVNGASQIKGTTSDGTLAYYDAGGAVHSVECVTLAPAAGGAVSVGAAVRCIDHLNFISIRSYGSSNVQVYSTVAGSAAQLAMLSHSHTPGDKYKLAVDNTNDTLTVYINDVQSGSVIDISGVLSGTNVGFYTKTADPAIGDLTIESVSTDSISIDAYADRKVFPVFGASRTHTVSGTYTGTTAPSLIECRVSLYVAGTVVIDWFTLDSSPSGGTYSGTVDMPKGMYYKIETRFSNVPTVISQTSRIGFGMLGDGGGQSNMVALFGTGGDATPSDNTAIFDGSSSWAVPASQHIAHVLNAISVANNCVVAMYTTAVSSSSIAQHLSGGSYYAANKAKQAAAGDEENLFFWGQGEGDTSNAAAYKNSLNLLYQDKLSTLGQAADTLPMFIVQLGRNAGASGNDAGWQGVREAQTMFANENANVYISHQTMDLPMTDGLHRTSAGYKMEALRAADTIISIIVGGTSGLGPIPTTAVLLGDTLTIEHSLNGSASLTVPGTVVDNFEVSSDDFATTIPIISSSVSGSAIEFTLGSTPTGNVKVRSQQGQDPIVANMATGSKLYNGQEVMIAPIVTSITSQGAINSTAVFNVTGIPNGTYLVTVFSASRPATLIFSSDLVFSGGSASRSVSIATGTQLYGIVRDSSDPSIGTAALKTITT